MGAWGAGSFDNDAALDFAAEIETVDDLARAFSAAGSGEEVDANESCRIIVAAECVASMRGHPSPAMPADLAERVESFGKAPMALFNSARDNLSAVMSRSELLELWSESEDMASFARALTELMERLNKPQAKLVKGAKAAKPKKLQPNPSHACSATSRWATEHFICSISSYTKTISRRQSKVDGFTSSA